MGAEGPTGLSQVGGLVPVEGLINGALGVVSGLRPARELPNGAPQKDVARQVLDRCAHPPTRARVRCEARAAHPRPVPVAVPAQVLAGLKPSSVGVSSSLQSHDGSQPGPSVPNQVGAGKVQAEEQEGGRFGSAGSDQQHCYDQGSWKYSAYSHAGPPLSIQDPLAVSQS